MAPTDLADYDATSLFTAAQDCLSTWNCQSTIFCPLPHENKSVQWSHAPVLVLEMMSRGTAGQVMGSL